MTVFFVGTNEMSILLLTMSKGVVSFVTEYSKTNKKQNKKQNIMGAKKQNTFT